MTTKPLEQSAVKTRHYPPYHVIIENDDHHTFGFVVHVVRQVLGHSHEKAVQLANQAHETGRAIVWTGPLELAELKAEQMQTFHETYNGRQLGPLGVTIEPAPE